MPFFTPRESAHVEAYRLPLDRETAISDSMWLWLEEKDMPARHRLQKGVAPGAWVVLSRDGNWTFMSDAELNGTYKPLEG